MVEQIGELVRRWPVEGFAREMLPDRQCRLVWIDRHVIGQLDYLADAAEEQSLAAVIRPLSQVTGVYVNAYGSAEAIGERTYRRAIVGCFGLGDSVKVDTTESANHSLRGHADRFIDVVLMHWQVLPSSVNRASPNRPVELAQRGPQLRTAPRGGLAGIQQPVGEGVFPDGALAHQGQVELSRGVLSAKQRPMLGGQAFGWDRKAPGSSVLVAASLALWGVSCFRPARPYVRRTGPREALILS
ncbi:hypothetical protein A5649_09105 [Mycolicibacter heraklionensis]|uniref:Uncharacterized protein n=1 Tax=Mycolicibacter heraklionensis TaxID=512402 RepID=A0AA91EVX8_9MYCO|nr:hypothetical protein A5649_09105 [Mycolicibacter heraklionensis]